MHMQNAVFKFILCKCVFPKNWTCTSIWLKSDLWSAPTNSMQLHCQIFNSLRQMSPDIKFVKADQRFDFHHIDVFMKYNVSQIIPRKGIYLWINSSDTSSILDAEFNFSWMHWISWWTILIYTVTLWHEELILL